MELAVSSSEEACSSVREDRSRLPVAIWLDAVAIVSVPLLTWDTIRTRLSFIALRACNSCPVSSVVLTSIRLVRSPLATVVAIFNASVTGRVIEIVIQ
ncbi:MAG: hypothetical protein JWR25_51 [Noviherbaspirillum sp.]|nr:hypothetical protein [Noviherbaspirillum sp.]